MGEAVTACHHLRGCLTSLSLLMNLCVCSVCEWSHAGLACFGWLVASRSLSVVFVIQDRAGASVRCLCPKRLGAQEGGQPLSVRWRAVYGLDTQCKGWVAEICPFLAVTDSLSACEALAAICCCINRQQSELEQLAHGSRRWPFALLTSYSGQDAKIHLQGKLF